MYQHQFKTLQINESVLAAYSEENLTIKISWLIWYITGEIKTTQSRCVYER